MSLSGSFGSRQSTRSLRIGASTSTWCRIEVSVARASVTSLGETSPGVGHEPLGDVDDALDLLRERLLLQPLDHVLLGEGESTAKLRRRECAQVEALALELDQAGFELWLRPGDDEIEQGLRRRDRGAVIGEADFEDLLARGAARLPRLGRVRPEEQT
jgi:hypothetical protein